MQHLFQTSSNIKRRVERQVSMNGGPGSGSKPARCSSQGRTGLLLPPKSAARVEVTSKRNCPPPPPKSENTVLKPARVQGNNLSAALLLQKYSGSPLLGLLECGLGPARMWAWGLLECGPSSSKNTRGPPCGACSSMGLDLLACGLGACSSAGPPPPKILGVLLVGFARVCALRRPPPPKILEL